MSFLEDAATQWDLPVATKQVISQNDRNYHRPSELRNSSTVPMDISMADTPAPNQDNKIKIVQQLLKTSPLGVTYTGPTDGNMNSELKTSLKLLESKANEKFKDKKFSFLSGDSIVAYQVVKFFEELNKLKNAPDSKNISSSKDIEDFEKLFNLPVTGILNDKLKTSIKSTEELINSTLKLTVPVKILEGDKVKYTASDVAGALKKINEFKKSNSDQKSK